MLPRAQKKKKTGNRPVFFFWKQFPGPSGKHSGAATENGIQVQHPGAAPGTLFCRRTCIRTVRNAVSKSEHNKEGRTGLQFTFNLKANRTRLEASMSICPFSSSTGSS